MSDIVTAESLPAVLTAIGGVVAAIIVSLKGGRLGDEAKHLTPMAEPSTKVAGLYIDPEGAKAIAAPLVRIADVLEGWADDTREFRKSKADETLAELLDRVRSLTEKEAAKPAARGR